VKTTNQAFTIDSKNILARLANDKDLFRELIEIYREDYPVLLTRIEIAIAERKSSELEQASHALKGLISNFLHDPTTALALQLEKKGRLNDWNEIDSDFAYLKVATARLLHALDTAVVE
jgi:HPt (histidine-containing phosphotransfer) domain-containing protein